MLLPHLQKFSIQKIYIPSPLPAWRAKAQGSSFVSSGYSCHIPQLQQRKGREL